MVHLSLLSVYNFIRRGLVRGLAEKTAKSKSMAFKSKSSKSGLKSQVRTWACMHIKYLVTQKLEKAGLLGDPKFLSSFEAPSSPEFIWLPEFLCLFLVIIKSICVNRRWETAQLVWCNQRKINTARLYDLTAALIADASLSIASRCHSNAGACRFYDPATSGKWQTLAVKISWRFVVVSPSE